MIAPGPAMMIVVLTPAITPFMQKISAGAGGASAAVPGGSIAGAETAMKEMMRSIATKTVVPGSLGATQQVVLAVRLQSRPLGRHHWYAEGSGDAGDARQRLRRAW